MSYLIQVYISSFGEDFRLWYLAKSGEFPVKSFHDQLIRSGEHNCFFFFLCFRILLLFFFGFERFFYFCLVT